MGAPARTYESSEIEPNRQAHLAYLQGEVYRSQGDTESARRAFHRVLDNYGDEQAVATYARYSLGLSYLDELDSLHSGLFHLNTLGRRFHAERS